MNKLSYLLLILLMFSFIPSTKAATFTVSSDTELINAINTANTNGVDDVITFAANITLTVTNNITDGNNGLPSILPDSGSTLTIEGNGFALRRSTAGGTSDFRLMHIAPNANVFINDLTLENGLAAASGLGVMGGAIFSWGQLTVDNSVFNANVADGGNGFGGAIASIWRTLTVTNSRFTANTSSNTGGAIFMDDNSGTQFSGNSFSNNSASFGGAMGLEGGNISLVNNTISGNAASSQGGGIYTGFSATITLRNNTITNNTAANAGGGIYNIFDGVVNLHNTIVSGNSAPSGIECFNETTFTSAVINANSYNIFGTGSSAGGCPAGANDIVPTGAIGTILNTSLANNGGSTLTHALILTNPAIDAANNSNCPVNDQRGYLRGFDANGSPNSPQIGDCDIGAFEYSLAPAYASNPAVGSSIVLGSTPVGTEISTILEISEVGQAALSVSLLSITGTNAADFNIIALPTVIGNNNAPQDIAIICTPSGSGLRTASISFSTNDPVQPTVSYNLECTGTDSIVASASLLGINQIVTEGNTTVSITVQLDVPAGFSDTGDVTVEVLDAATGNATSGSDYTAFPATTLTFTGPLVAGATYTQSVNIDILDDPAIEGAEALALMINSLTGAAETGFPDTHTIVINDNDANIFAQASFVANSAIIDEDAGTLSIDVELFIPAGFNLTGDVTLTISDGLAGNASSGSDYSAFAPVTLTFVDAPFVVGTTYTQTVTLNILDDTLVEGAETVELAITGISGPVALVSPASFTAIINDDEIATVTIIREGETIIREGETITVTTGGGDTDFVFKTVDNPLATIGQTVTYTIRARNPKTIPLTEVVIYDVFDERLSDVRLISTTHGTGIFNANTLTVSGFSLQPNEEAVIVVSARIASLISGETIPNAAILESPDASVHVSNLVLVGDHAEANSGGAAQVFIVPNQLPSTGESPLWRYWVIVGMAGISLLFCFYLYQKRVTRVHP